MSSGKKVGIMTWHYYPNFGSALQAYALQNSIRDLGYEVEILNYRNSKFGRYNKATHIKSTVKYALGKVICCRGSISKRIYDPFLTFSKCFMNETRLEQEENKLTDLCDGMDAVICGSDQIWAPNVFNPVYMLDFVPEDVSKISYAASVGLNDIPKKLCKQYSDLLQKFKKVSVREQAAADLLRSKCNIEADVVLDPTLLVDVEHWKTIEAKHSQMDGDYVFCYFLNANHQYQELVIDYANRHNLKIVGYSAKQGDCEWMDTSKDRMGPCEFLWLIHHAMVVLTDSYHGTIFSLLFHKDFITFERFQNTDVICQNSRIYQLDSYFGIADRIKVASNCDSLKVELYDYQHFESELQALREKSFTYLRESLEV